MSLLPDTDYRTRGIKRDKFELFPITQQGPSILSNIRIGQYLSPGHASTISGMMTGRSLSVKLKHTTLQSWILGLFEQ